jgi:hypothetical protein
LCDGLFVGQGGQGHFRLELGTVLFTCLAHL